MQAQLALPLPSRKQEPIPHRRGRNDGPAAVADRGLPEDVIGVGFGDRPGGVGQVDSGTQPIGRVVVGGAAVALQGLIDAGPKEVAGDEGVGIVAGFDDEIIAIVEELGDDPVHTLGGAAAKGVVCDQEGSLTRARGLSKPRALVRLSKLSKNGKQTVEN